MKRLLALLLLLLPAACFGQGQDSIRASGGILTISLVPSASRYKVFVDQTITSTVFTNPIPAAVITVLFVQDTAGHTVAFGGNIGSGCTVSSTASSTTGCQFTFDSANNAWTAIGGGGSSVAVVGLPLGNTIYESTACPPATPQCFQVFNDVHASNNAVYTATSTSVSTASTDPAFVAGDVGKIEFGAGNCPGTVSNCTYQVPQGTIQTVNSAHNVTVSVAATGTNSGTANANNFFWGDDDGPQHVLAFQALFPTTFGGTVVPEPAKALQLACGFSFTSVPPFVVSSSKSTNGGGLQGCGGGGSTVIIPLPKMSCNNAIGAGCLFSNTVNNLQLNGLNLGGWHVRDISFWGGGTDVKDAAATYTNPNGIVIQQFDELDNVLVIGWVWKQASTVGVVNHGGLMVNSGSVAGGLVNCLLLGSNNVSSVMLGGTCGGSITGPGTSISLQVGASGSASQAYTTGVYVNQNSAFGVVAAAGPWWSHGDYITTSININAASSAVYLTGTAVDQFGGGNSAITISAGVVHLTGVLFKASGGPINQTGGTVYDDCGNGVLPGTAPVITNLFGDCSVTGVADAAGKHVLSAGFGTTATVTAVGGSVTTVTFTVNSSGTGQAANPTITDTFATPFWASPSAGCSLIQIGGTFGVLTNPVPSSLSRTGVTWTFSGTPVAAQSYIFQRICRNS